MDSNHRENTMDTAVVGGIVAVIIAVLVIVIYTKSRKNGEGDE